MGNESFGHHVDCDGDGLEKLGGSLFSPVLGGMGIGSVSGNADGSAGMNGTGAVDSVGDSADGPFSMEFATLRMFFDLRVNPFLLKFKKIMARYADDLNSYLDRHEPIPDKLFADCGWVLGVAISYFNSLFAELRVLFKNPNTLVNSLLGMIEHEVKSVFTNAISYAQLELASHVSANSNTRFFEGCDRLQPVDIDLQALNLRPHAVKSLVLTAINHGFPSKGPYVTTVEDASVAMCPDEVNVHPAIVICILTELRENAAKAIGKREGTITMSVRSEGENVIISVTDNGPGIPPEIIGRIFENGFTTRSRNGTGQGLYLARKYIEEVLHGRIIVESTVGEGSVFSIVLRKT